MRILHTSDWHLGRSFHREGMLGHQAEFVDHLVEVVAQESVDVVVVAGDVFDRALPAADAVAVADEALARLAHTGVRVVITSGNHDSAIRLGANSRLIDAAGVHLRADPDGVGTPVLIDDRHGTVAFHGIPYLEPEVVRQRWSLPRRSHQAALDEAMRRVRTDLAGRPGVRSVVAAHAFVAGAMPSDSERDITVGGVNRVGLGTFTGIDYTALGHLHGPHELSASVRYSGSPLAYSFSEAAHTKGSWLIDLGADGVSASTFVPAPVPRRLARLRGTLRHLLESTAFVGDESAFVQATITDPVRPVGAHDQLIRRFPHLMALSFTATASGAPIARPVAAGRSTHEVTLDFVSQVRGVSATPDEVALLDDAVAACCEHEDAPVSA